MPNDDATDQEQRTNVDSVENPDAEEFHAWYGDWAAFTPQHAAAFFAEFDRPWWVVGGWAIEAFTGQPRDHEDIDIAIFREDADRLRTFCSSRFHAWAVGSGTLRPYNDALNELPDWAGQLWLRANAGSPWVLDVNLQLGHYGTWQSKRDPSHRADLERTTFIDNNGLRYQNPEIVLLHKAAHTRPKDRLDFRTTLPHLSHEQQIWLADSLQRIHPGHPWTQLVNQDTPSS